MEKYNPTTDEKLKTKFEQLKTKDEVWEIDLEDEDESRD